MKYTCTDEKTEETTEIPWTNINAYAYQIDWTPNNVDSFSDFFGSLWDEFNKRYWPLISSKKDLTCEEASELYNLYFHKLLPMITGLPIVYLKDITTRCFTALCQYVIKSYSSISDRAALQAQQVKGDNGIYLQETFRHYRNEANTNGKQIFDLGPVLEAMENVLVAVMQMNVRVGLNIELSDIARTVDLIYPNRYSQENNLDIARMFATKHSILFTEKPALQRS